MPTKPGAIESHPWINFTVDLDRAPAPLWLMLGESCSKCENLATAALLPETAKSLHRLYLAKGALATTAIEGNTLTEAQALALVEGHLELPPSKQYLAQEMQNIIECCNWVVGSIEDGVPLELSPSTIKEFNRRVLDQLELEEGVVPGEVRTHNVGVALYRGAPWEHCEDLLAQTCDWLNSFDTSGPDRVRMAVLKAILAHLYLAWIHPFGDGNGRTARLVEFLILVTSGVPTPASHLLSNHYNQTRSEYYRQLDRTSRTGGEVFPFVQYALGGFVDELRAQLVVVREQQKQLVWRYYIEEIVFQGKHSPTDQRRKQLVIALSENGESIRRQDLTGLTPGIARLYATKTEKTMSRDINWLEDEGLIEREPGNQVRARLELMEAFVPTSVKDD